MAFYLAKDRIMEKVNWQKTRDVLISIICIGAILWAVWIVGGHFVEAIIILLLAMTVAFLLSPTVDLLVRYRVPRILATLISFILMLTIVGAFGYALVLSLIQQSLKFSDIIQNFATNLPGNLPQTFDSFFRALNESGIPQQSINEAISSIQAQVTAFAQNLATGIIGFVLVFTGALLNIVAVLVISFYLTLDGKRIRDGMISVVPKRALPHVLVFEDALNRVVGNYIRGQLTLAFIVGCAASLVCVVTGLSDYALIVGVLAFLFETIPMIGPALASITPIVLSLLLPDPYPRTVYVILWFVAIQLIESNILGPRIVGNAVGLHPVASLLALLVGAKLFGPVGALIATPIVAAIWVVIASLYHSIRGETADEMLAKKKAPWTLRNPTGYLRMRIPRSGRLPATAPPEPESEAIEVTEGENGQESKTEVLKKNPDS